MAFKYYGDPAGTVPYGQGGNPYAIETPQAEQPQQGGMGGVGMQGMEMFTGGGTAAGGSAMSGGSSAAAAPSSFEALFAAGGGTGATGGATAGTGAASAGTGGAAAGAGGSSMGSMAAAAGPYAAIAALIAAKAYDTKENAGYSYKEQLRDPGLAPTSDYDRLDDRYDFDKYTMGAGDLYKGSFKPLKGDFKGWLKSSASPLKALKDIF